MPLVRRLLAPRWLVRHLALVAVCVLFVMLGRWQYHRAEGTHSVQNWGYAVEWVVFAFCAVYGYTRLVREELAREARQAAGLPEPPRADAPRVVPDGAARDGDLALQQRAALSAAVAADEADDPEVRAYNDWLASYAQRGRKR